MSRSYRYLHYDVFTDRLFGGNQLAVLVDARGLSGDTMQSVAKEMSFSETTFILPAERPDTDVRMRIFTPGSELPMAGHPTVGSTFALAHEQVIASGQPQFVFGLGIGPTPVTMTWRGADLAFVWMTQSLPIFHEALSDPAQAAAALSLPASAVVDTAKPVQVISCGVPFLFVPLTTRKAVDAASVDRSALDALLASTNSGAHGVFLFSAEPGADGATVYSRMFAPELGVVEDSATGSASGPLGCYLVRHKIVPAETAAGGILSVLSLQGVKMGRPSHVHIAIGAGSSDGPGRLRADGASVSISSVRVGGTAVLAGEGVLYL
jgi:trans-2,3-dihydro-3-hydroxyanthranilate isomerase